LLRRLNVCVLRRIFGYPIIGVDTKRLQKGIEKHRTIKREISRSSEHLSYSWNPNKINQPETIPRNWTQRLHKFVAEQTTDFVVWTSSLAI
jgi:hypothetical protein